MVGASVIMFRGQEHLTRDGLIKFAEYFGELGAHHGERDHMQARLKHRRVILMYSLSNLTRSIQARLPSSIAMQPGRRDLR